MLAWLNLRNEKVVSTLEHDVDVDREVLIRVRQHQEVEELRVVKEEKPVEGKSFLLEVLVSFLLQDQVVLGQLLED